jgi:hypothetical protein
VPHAWLLSQMQGHWSMGKSCSTETSRPGWGADVKTYAHLLEFRPSLFSTQVTCLHDLAIVVDRASSKSILHG